jgi:predicted thioesterase
MIVGRAPARRTMHVAHLAGLDRLSPTWPARTGYGAGVELAAGVRSWVRIVVSDTDTAMAMGSGDVPVLGTPRLLALAEAAAVAAVTPALQPGVTSVGTSAALEHTRASPVGAEVVVEAELTEVEGRRLAFRFIARQKQPAAPARQEGSAGQEDVVVGAGTLERVLVERERFVRQASHQPA